MYIAQHGISLATMHSDKYNLDFDIEKTVIRLTNQLWKLIPMRENEENYKKQLNIVTIEIAGLHEIFQQDTLLEILSKLEGLNALDTEFEDYRTTVFKCISLLKEVQL